jgi:hypothetical protein
MPSLDADSAALLAVMHVMVARLYASRAVQEPRPQIWLREEREKLLATLKHNVDADGAARDEKRFRGLSTALMTDIMDMAMKLITAEP